MDEDEKFKLLKEINGKLTWGLLFLFAITLNTCSAADDIEDAVRGNRAASPAPAEAPAP
jgi:hypothetical protein